MTPCLIQHNFMGYIKRGFAVYLLLCQPDADSYEHRIAAMDALRYDLAMPGVPHNKAKISLNDHERRGIYVQP